MVFCGIYSFSAVEEEQNKGKVPIWEGTKSADGIRCFEGNVDQMDGPLGHLGHQISGNEIFELSRAAHVIFHSWMNFMIFILQNLGMIIYCKGKLIRVTFLFSRNTILYG